MTFCGHSASEVSPWASRLLCLQHCADKNSRCRSEMNVQAAWKRGYTGKNVVVTILDDGIERNHPDLAPNYVSPTSDLTHMVFNHTSYKIHPNCLSFSPNTLNQGTMKIILGRIRDAFSLAPGKALQRDTPTRLSHTLPECRLENRNSRAEVLFACTLACGSLRVKTQGLGPGSPSSSPGSVTCLTPGKLPEFSVPRCYHL